MPPKDSDERPRVNVPTRGEFKDNPTLTLPMPKSRKDFTFGRGKALTILQYLEDIKKFVEDTE